MRENDLTIFLNHVGGRWQNVLLWHHTESSVKETRDIIAHLYRHNTRSVIFLAAAFIS